MMELDWMLFKKNEINWFDFEDFHSLFVTDAAKLPIILRFKLIKKNCKFNHLISILTFFISLKK
jgi:hypothetical protein